MLGGDGVEAIVSEVRYATSCDGGRRRAAAEMSTCMSPHMTVHEDKLSEIHDHMTTPPSTAAVAEILEQPEVQQQLTPRARGVSMDLALQHEYHEATHLPLYSQAEMDAARSAWSRSQTEVMNTRVQEIEQEMSTRCIKAEELVCRLQMEVSALREQLASSHEGEDERIANLERDVVLLRSANKVMKVMLMGCIDESRYR